MEGFFSVLTRDRTEKKAAGLRPFLRVQAERRRKSDRLCLARIASAARAGSGGAGASLPGAEERYRKLVLKWEEMQAIERALERQVLRWGRWRKVWGAGRRAVRWRGLLRLLKKIRVVGA